MKLKNLIRELQDKQLDGGYRDHPEVRQGGSGVQIITHGLDNREISFLSDHLPQLIKDLQTLQNYL